MSDFDKARQFFFEGIASMEKGNFPAAEQAFCAALKLTPGRVSVITNLAAALIRQEKYEAAMDYALQSTSQDPDNAQGHLNLGLCLAAAGKHEEAIANYDKALSIDSDYADAWLNRGVALNEIRRHEEALKCQDKALSINPDYAAAWLNRGNVLKDLRRHESALACYDRALVLNAEFEEAWFNRGNILRELVRQDEALLSFDAAIRIKPGYAEAWFNRGLALADVRRYDEALVDFSNAISLNANIDYLYGHWLYTKMCLCDWTAIDQAFLRVDRMVNSGRKGVYPFSFLGMTASPATQKICAEIFSRDKYHDAPNKAAHPPDIVHGNGNGKRMKIGYFSADFHDHATSHLMSEVFEKHDRSKFELIAFSFGPEIKDQVRQRVSAAFDRFIDVSDTPDDEVARLARDIGIGIAIDLKGFTKDCRPQIFALRAAPVQVNYLGYPGTMGMECMDYVIADRTLITSEDVEHYTEKIVFMPHSYQANDSTKKISESTPTRKSLGLPESGFVFASFNNNYKISPEVFDIWMRLLQRVPGSVLWIFRTNISASSNLCRQAESRGVAPDRLVFADRMDLADHLARHCAADLFLDTFNVNAHTTASDALWAGLPVVTCRGGTFAGRVAASLLTAIGLPELIAETPEQYESLAFDLATKPDMLAATKRKLARNRLTQPLFNTALFVRHLEAAYEAMWDRFRQGLAPDHIDVQE